MMIPAYLVPVVCWLAAWGILGHFDVFLLTGRMGVFVGQQFDRLIGRK